MGALVLGDKQMDKINRVYELAKAYDNGEINEEAFRSGLVIAISEINDPDELGELADLINA